MRYVYDNIKEEINRIKNRYDILLIEIGRAVEEVLDELQQKGLVNEKQILYGFPHPSGANVNRVAQFKENKEAMMEFIKNRFS